LWRPKEEHCRSHSIEGGEGWFRPVSTTRVTRHIRAPRARVYRALLNRESPALGWRISIDKLAGLVEQDH